MKSLEELQELLPGAEFLGMYTDPHVNYGAPTPIFTSKPRTDGRPSINTPEGWNALTDRVNRRAFVHEFGREPSCDAELYAWEESNFTKDFRWEGRL